MIQYLNTDLDLVSAGDLSALAAELEAQGLDRLHVGRQEDGLWLAIFEAGVCWQDPEATISALLDVIETLDEPARRAWCECTKREFNIGYDCGNEPWAFNQALSSQTLRRMADVSAGLRITLYPESSQLPRKSHEADEGQGRID